MLYLLKAAEGFCFMCCRHGTEMCCWKYICIDEILLKMYKQSLVFVCVLIVYLHLKPSQTSKMGLFAEIKND